MGDLGSQPEKQIPIKSDSSTPGVAGGATGIERSQSPHPLDEISRPQESRGGTVSWTEGNRGAVTFGRGRLAEDSSPLDSGEIDRARDPNFQSRHEQAVRDNVSWNRSEAERILKEQEAQMERIKQRLLRRGLISSEVARQFTVRMGEQSNPKAAGGIEFVVNRQMPPEYAHLWDQQDGEGPAEEGQAATQQNEDTASAPNRESRQTLHVLQGGKTSRRTQMPPLRRRDSINDADKIAA